MNTLLVFFGVLLIGMGIFSYLYFKPISPITEQTCQWWNLGCDLNNFWDTIQNAGISVIDTLDGIIRTIGEIEVGIGIIMLLVGIWK